jgi:hypothetical protein
MTTVVTLDVFSGLENPTWHLGEKAEKELDDRIASLRVTAGQRPMDDLAGLGYRGFTLEKQAAPGSVASRSRIEGGIVDYGGSRQKFTDDTGIEQFLLRTLPGHLSAEVQAHVTDRVNSQMSSALASSAHGSGCPACHASDAPAYNPGGWNTPLIQPHNNCYAYANDQANVKVSPNKFAQPGRGHGVSLPVMDCKHIQYGARADGLVIVPNIAAPLASGAGWYVALVVWPGVDYHWYRQDLVGCWSHKPGAGAVTDRDNGGNAIADPRLCNRGPYTIFCDYMVTRRGLAIA